METSAPQLSDEAMPPEQESIVTVVGPMGRKSRHKAEDIRAYDFRQPAFLAPTELRKLRQRHDDFARSLSARLSMYLRLEVSLEVTKLQTVRYQDFTASLGTPTHLTLFKAEPLKGICLLDIPPRLGLTMVDRLLGGPGSVSTADRDLTEIETALLDQAVQIVLNEWCRHWQSFEDLRLGLLGHESNGKFLQTAPHDTMMICISMETHIGDCVAQMQMAFPHYALEPIVKHLTAASATEKADVKAPAIPPARWNSELDRMPVSVSAQWDGLQMTARELVALKPGDVLMLDPQVTQQVQVHVASAPKYKARLGTRGGNWAVELTQPLTN
ncbi:MAG TPA: flagellar motor switch protein FliM [Candidatus Limnocylindria bacterium]|nr:flagellar motor switch protein FliM [Candidatus Limnocylindria bacterium]